jgi:hypothetical protein
MKVRKRRWRLTACGKDGMVEEVYIGEIEHGNRDNRAAQQNRGCVNYDINTWCFSG